jgi:hypothetical protein
VHFDDQTSALASGELRPGERVIWSGGPDSTCVFALRDVFVIPFSLVWTGMASVGAAISLASADLVGGLFSVPFVLFGIYMTFGRFFVRVWVRKRTVYALTDRRILALRPGWRDTRHTSSVWLASHPPVEKRIGRDGRGTVWVGRPTSDQRGLGDEWGWPQSGSSAVAFLDIPEADGVAWLIARQLGELGDDAQERHRGSSRRCERSSSGTT